MGGVSVRPGQEETTFLVFDLPQEWLEGELVFAKGGAEATVSIKGLQALPTLTPTSTPAPTDTPRPTETPGPTDTPTPTPKPQHFTGRGQQVSRKFTLRTGLTIFHMTHDGSSNFAIVLLDDKGKSIELLVNEIGSFDGGRAVGVEPAGAYLLDIAADGNWTITLEQPGTQTSAPTPPQTFTGRGQQVSPMFWLAEGLVTFRMRHDGESNFAIVLLDDEGSRIELLVNEIGSFDGAKALGIGRAGVYLLDIAADGDWSITVEQ